MKGEDYDVKWMGLALKEARSAGEKDEVPVGAVFVFDGRVIARARNQCELLNDPTAHAEMIGITQACAALSTQRLTGVEVYVTKEPCAMCAGALVHSRIDRLIVGARDEKAGACGTVLQVIDQEKLNHRIPVTFGVLGGECGELLTHFFKARRRGGDTTGEEA